MLVAIFKGHAKRIEREHNERVWLAWNTAALTRVDRMPSLSSMLVTRASRGPQTLADHRAAIRALAGVEPKGRA